MSQKQVTVYTTPTCPHCHTLKRFLSEKGVDFTEVDLTEDATARDKVEKATGMLAVPQTQIEENWVVGFDEAQISQYLSL